MISAKNYALCTITAQTFACAAWVYDYFTVILQVLSLPLYVRTVTHATPGFIALKEPVQFVLVIFTILLLLLRKVRVAQPAFDGTEQLSVAV